MSSSPPDAPGSAEASGRPRVLYVQYTNPALYPPLLHSIRLLADAGCDVRLVGIDTMARDLATPFPAGVTARLLPAEAPGWRQKVSYARFARATMREARAFRPHWIYASDALSTPAVKLVVPGARSGLVYHEHDAPVEAWQPHTASWFMRRVMSARRDVARRADLCVLPNAARAESFRETTGRADVTVVWNCPRREEAASEPRRAASRRTRVLFHGSIVPARLPLSVVDALTLVPPDVDLVFVGYETLGHPGYVRAVLDHARARGVEARVKYAGVLSRSGLLDLGSTADVGLALLPTSSTDSNEAHMAGASNKVFEYLARGLPVLVADTAEWRDSFVAAGVARACRPESAESIAAALGAFLRDPDERRAMGERGRRRVLADWNYETQFEPVLQAMIGDHGRVRARATG